MERAEAIKKIRQMSLSKETIEILEILIPELRESEDEKSKNKSGYYKGGKFWKASTLWNAVKNKTPQRVENRYILQQCSWNIGTLQDFANEIKNVQETNLDYPIILDISGHILDGAHRVVKAYLEGKDINVVYLGDDEWPEPDYDEEKAVKESEDERIRKELIYMIKECTNWPHKKEYIKYLEKQKEQFWVPTDEQRHALGMVIKYSDSNADSTKVLESLLDDLTKIANPKVANWKDKQKEQKPAEWSEEDEKHRQWILECLADGKRKVPEFAEQYQAAFDWLKSLRPSWKPSEEELVALKRVGSILHDCGHGELAKMVFMIEGKLANLVVLNKSIWKPSEKQMGALSWMLENARGNIDFDPLKDLYKQLKKLM